MSRRGLASPTIDLKPPLVVVRTRAAMRGAQNNSPAGGQRGKGTIELARLLLPRHCSTGHNFQNYRRRIKGAIFQLVVGSTANWPCSRNQGSEPGDWRIRMEDWIRPRKIIQPARAPKHPRSQRKVLGHGQESAAQRRRPQARTSQRKQTPSAAEQRTVPP